MRKRGFLRDDQGATAIEYALVAACIAMVVMGGITKVGHEVSSQFADIAAHIENPTGSGTALPAGPIRLKPVPSKPWFPKYEKAYDPLRPDGSSWTAVSKVADSSSWTAKFFSSSPAYSYTAPKAYVLPAMPASLVTYKSW